jgi:pyrimidine-nucleoside phosphorylase
LYALRDVTATVDSVPLIASSVMSKKIAAGSEAIVLDVKYGSGAFMKTPDDARALATAMVGIGRSAGRRTVAVISAMEEPLGRAVGNALEVEEAVRMLQGDGPADLRDLCLVLGAQMLVLAGIAPDQPTGRRVLEDRLARGAALGTFRDMVQAQEGDPAIADHPERLPQASIRLPVPSEAQGTVLAVDAEALGTAAMVLGAGRERVDDHIDPAAGLVIARRLGDRVDRGAALAVIHTNEARRADEGIRRVRAAYRVGPGIPAARLPLVDAVVA